MKRILFLVFISLLFFVHLLIINEYGLTWDFHHHFFSGAYFLGYTPQEIEPRPLPYTEPDPRRTMRLPYGPFVQIVPTASYLLFHKTLRVLPEDSAYNFPIIIAGIGGISVLFLFLWESIGYWEGMCSALFLSLTPRFFSDMHNNMKDIPSASVFALNIWLLWRLFTYRRLKDLIFASIAFALAWNTKINAIFIPIIFLVWIGVVFVISKVHTRCSKHVRGENKKIFSDFTCSLGIHRWIQQCATEVQKYFFRATSAHILLILYFFLAPLFAFLLWTLFWGNGWAQILQMFETFGVGTSNIEVLLNGKWYCSSLNVPWYYAPWYLVITTPLPILILFIAGIFVAMRKTISHKPIYLLLLLYFVVPLLRYLSPKTGVIDGVRHFEEVLFPIAALAGIGAISSIVWIYMRVAHGDKKRGSLPVRSAGSRPAGRQKPSRSIFLFITSGLSALLFSSLILTIIRYHPFQITYFNQLVGGSKGAMGKYDLDYWGGSQKKAVEWLNENAPPNAIVYIVMASDVAARYLRPDLLRSVNTTDFLHAQYVVILNRQGFFYRYYGISDYLLTHTPIHTIQNQGVPLVWIFDNAVPYHDKSPKWWEGTDPCILY